MTESRRTFLARGAAVAGGIAAAGVTTSTAEAATTSAAAPMEITPKAAHLAAVQVDTTSAASAVNQQLNGLSGWYVPTDWGQSWRAKLQAARNGTGTAVAAMLGDSVGFGYWASNLVDTSWFERVRQDITAVGGYGGSGFQSQAHTSSVIYNPGSGVPDYYKGVPGNVWVQGGSWLNLTPPYIYGPGAGAIMATGNGATLENYIIGSKIGVWYYDWGAPFTVSVDGQVVGSVTVGTSGAVTRAVFDVPGGKLDIHSFRLTGNVNSSTNRGSTFLGVEGLHTSGVRLDNFSFPGMVSRYYANLDNPWFSGTYAGGTRNPADLIIYEIAGNDMGGQDPNYPNGTPADVWAQNVEGYLEGVVNSTFGGTATGKYDLLILFPMVNTMVDRYRLYAQYKSRALGIAQSYGAALFDLTAVFKGSWSAYQAAGYAGNQSDPTKPGTDANHPSDAGHSFLAAQLKPLLTALS